MTQRGLLGVVVAACLGTAPGTWAQGLSEPAMPLPAAVADAWTEVGATVGWMKADRGSLWFRVGIEGTQGEVPALGMAIRSGRTSCFAG